MEDYLRDARNLARLDVEPMQAHFEKLKAFIHQVEAQAREEERARSKKVLRFNVELARALEMWEWTKDEDIEEKLKEIAAILFTGKETK
jgi:hypothetical protein